MAAPTVDQGKRINRVCEPKVSRGTFEETFRSSTQLDMAESAVIQSRVPLSRQRRQGARGSGGLPEVMIDINVALLRSRTDI